MGTIRVKVVEARTTVLNRSNKQDGPYQANSP